MGETIQMHRIIKQLMRKGRRTNDMNGRFEIIGIDHGWSMMKTISQVFVTGVKEITTTPALFGDVLEYEGRYYKVGTVSLSGKILSQTECCTGHIRRSRKRK